MSNTLSIHPIWLKAAALFALLFGVMTLFCGGSVLLSSAAQIAILSVIHQPLRIIDHVATPTTEFFSP